MASFWPIITTLLIFTTHLFALAFSSSPERHNIKLSTISAAPAVLPGPPLYGSSSESPALSPDIAPLFPSPSKGPLSPTESSLPTIPSSPSPPNPDALVARGPGGAMAVPPSSGSLMSPSGSVGEFQVLILSGMVLSLMW